MMTVKTDHLVKEQMTIVEKRKVAMTLTTKVSSTVASL
jgi:hypothetical protein